VPPSTTSARSASSASTTSPRTTGGHGNPTAPPALDVSSQQSTRLSRARSASGPSPAWNQRSREVTRRRAVLGPVHVVADDDQLAPAGDVGLLDVDLGVGERAGRTTEVARLVRQRHHDDPAGGTDVEPGVAQHDDGLLGLVDEQVDDPLALARERADRLDVDAGFAEALAELGDHAGAVVGDDDQVLAHVPAPSSVGRQPRWPGPSCAVGPPRSAAPSARGYTPPPTHHVGSLSGVAQLAEHPPVKWVVAGSSPAPGAPRRATSGCRWWPVRCRLTSSAAIRGRCVGAVQ
jgi:hypothetical protein